METIKRIVMVEATKDNMKSIFEKIEAFAKEKGYQIKGDLKLPTNMLGIAKSPEFASKRQEKAIKSYMYRLNNHVSMSQANKFLHFLFKKVYKIDTSETCPCPRVEYSEKEQKIKSAKSAWKKLRAEADKLKAAYFEEKGDFYKKK